MLAPVHNRPTVWPQPLKRVKPEPVVRFETRAGTAGIRTEVDLSLKGQ